MIPIGWFWKTKVARWGRGEDKDEIRRVLTGLRDEPDQKRRLTWFLILSILSNFFLILFIGGEIRVIRGLLLTSENPLRAGRVLR